jgi:DNA helicase HerA-like ATPase
METHQNALQNGSEKDSQNVSQPMPAGFLDRLEEEIDLAGGEWQEDEEFIGAIGRTMYDAPTSKDNTVTVLLPADDISKVPSQSLVRIKSRRVTKGGDGRQYIAAVVAGPFAEPDGLRADAPIVVTTTVRGAAFMPRYHRRIQIEILGEEIGGTVIPPRFRPLPNSPVFVLNQAETASQLKLKGDVPLGMAVGYEDMVVALPTTRKDVFPRHTGILGTTGGGKSTTVSGLIGKLRDSGVAVVVFDTEGEYTQIAEPTEDPRMIAALERRGLQPAGISNVGLYHLIGRETTNEDYGDRKTFCLKYENLSPYAVMEILSFNDAQQERFLKAYDIARRVLTRLEIYPATPEEKAELLELDEMERGYPRLTLQQMYDIVRLCADTVAGEATEDTPLRSPEFRLGRSKILQVLKEANLKENKSPANVSSWHKVQGSLSRLLRLGVFDTGQPPDYKMMTQPGRVTIVDLSDTDSAKVNNLVISEILRGLHLRQDENYREYEKQVKQGKTNATMKKVEVVIEEAHEFLSAERIRQMPVLFQQVARIARRGRKRWLGLMFVTQLPQHLPDEVLGLINNYILHKIADANVISRLKRSVGGVEDGLWTRLPNLAPGQAIVSAASLARPLLVAIDPTSCKLRMID